MTAEINLTAVPVTPSQFRPRPLSAETQATLDGPGYTPVELNEEYVLPAVHHQGDNMTTHDARDVLAVALTDLGHNAGESDELADDLLAALAAAGLVVIPRPMDGQVRFDGGLWQVIASNYDDLPTVTIRLRPVDGET